VTSILKSKQKSRHRASEAGNYKTNDDSSNSIGSDQSSDTDWDSEYGQNALGACNID
jgi:hypothetical protein